MTNCQTLTFAFKAIETGDATREKSKPGTQVQ